MAYQSGNTDDFSGAPNTHIGVTQALGEFLAAHDTGWVDVSLPPMGVNPRWGFMNESRGIALSAYGATTAITFSVGESVDPDTKLMSAPVRLAGGAYDSNGKFEPLPVYDTATGAFSYMVVGSVPYLFIVTDETLVIALGTKYLVIDTPTLFDEEYDCGISVIETGQQYANRVPGVSGPGTASPAIVASGRPHLVAFGTSKTTPKGTPVVGSAMMYLPYASTDGPYPSIHANQADDIPLGYFNNTKAFYSVSPASLGDAVLVGDKRYAVMPTTGTNQWTYAVELT